MASIITTRAAAETMAAAITAANKAKERIPDVSGILVFYAASVGWAFAMIFLYWIMKKITSSSTAMDQEIG